MPDRPSRDPATILQLALLSRLKVRHLALVEAVDRQRTLVRAANELGLSQPAVTKALHEVEDIFGSRLFERTPRGLAATPAGEAVLQHARRWLADLESTTRALTAIEAGRRGRLRVGMISYLPAMLMSAALSHLMNREPRVDILTREGTTDELVGALRARDLDCVFGRSFEGDSTDLIQELIYQQEEACLLAAAGSVDRLSRGPLDWARLARLNWILPPVATPLRRTINTIFVIAGVQPPVPILETLSLRGIQIALKQDSNAVTILSRDVAWDLAQDGKYAIVPYKLRWDMPPLTFFTTQHFAGNPLVSSLRDAVRHAARDLERSRPPQPN